MTKTNVIHQVFAISRASRYTRRTPDIWLVHPVMWLVQNKPFHWKHGIHLSYEPDGRMKGSGQAYSWYITLVTVLGQVYNKNVTYFRICRFLSRICMSYTWRLMMRRWTWSHPGSWRIITFLFEACAAAEDHEQISSTRKSIRKESLP